MPRPVRIEDARLTEQVRRHMATKGLSAREMADMVFVDKSTFGRSLAAGAFSRIVGQRLRDIVDPLPKGRSIDQQLHIALRLLSASDRLRERAERMMIKALDQASARK